MLDKQCPLHNDNAAIIFADAMRAAHAAAPAVGDMMSMAQGGAIIVGVEYAAFRASLQQEAFAPPQARAIPATQPSRQ